MNKATKNFIARSRPRVLIQSADLESLQARREGGFHQRIFDNLVMEADQQLTFPYEYTPRGWHPVGLDAEWRARRSSKVLSQSHILTSAGLGCDVTPCP